MSLTAGGRILSFVILKLTGDQALRTKVDNSSAYSQDVIKRIEFQQQKTDDKKKQFLRD